MMAVKAALLLLAVVAVASAARLPETSWRISEDVLSSSVQTQTSDAFPQWLTQAGKKDKEPAYVAFRYFVEPDRKDAFVKAWLDLEDKTQDEKGVRIFDLKKSVTDNVLFVGYGEWDSLEDYVDHYKSDYVANFLKSLRDNDITYTIIPLTSEQVTEVTPKKGDKSDDTKMAHVLVRYVVPPSQHKDFIQVWDEAAKLTSDEKGAHIYSLRKVFNDNYQFWTYGTWESWKDYNEHFKSDHIVKMVGELDKRGIMWHITPLKKIGHQPE